MTTTFRSLLNTRFPTGELEPGCWYVDAILSATKSNLGDITAERISDGQG